MAGIARRSLLRIPELDSSCNENHCLTLAKAGEMGKHDWQT